MAVTAMVGADGGWWHEKAPATVTNSVMVAGAVEFRVLRAAAELGDTPPTPLGSSAAPRR